MTNAAVLKDEQSLAADKRMAWMIGAAGSLHQMLFNDHYGNFRDELYYIACSNHLAFS
jgi:hypothetical protein